jgi:hypothetical protein
MKIGDLVEVVKVAGASPTPSLLGRRGRIVFISFNKKWADVLLDGDATATDIRTRVLRPITPLDLLAEIAPAE